MIVGLNGCAMVEKRDKSVCTGMIEWRGGVFGGCGATSDARREWGIALVERLHVMALSPGHARNRCAALHSTPGLRFADS